VSKAEARRGEPQALGDVEHFESHQIVGDAESPQFLQHTLLGFAAQGFGVLQGVCLYLVEAPSV
jgi:hypothetical protein